MPSLSIIASFRDREAGRVRRFLDSLSRQTDPEFELIFLDYGSQEKVSEQIQDLCNQYSFCRYIYNHTRGMYWNRAHAMNSAARFSDREYLLFTDPSECSYQGNREQL